jgi:F0F1-type ATP synthase assembly protein I
LVYLGALLGYLGDRLFGRSTPFTPLYYLVAMNLALVLGFWRTLTNRQEITWERVEH